MPTQQTLGHGRLPHDVEFVEPGRKDGLGPRQTLFVRPLVVAVVAAMIAAFGLTSAAQADESATPQVPTSAEAAEEQPVPTGHDGEQTSDSTADRVSVQDVSPETHDLVRKCGVLWGIPYFGSPYCDLSQNGQFYLAGGALTFVASAICAATLAFCPVAATAAWVAAAYINDHGICPGNQALRIVAWQRLSVQVHGCV